jgi:probable selenium-dependent hydroxylase accessory protein YqeC
MRLYYKEFCDENAETSLVSAFGISANTRIIALVGAGGKTTLMYALARELAAKGLSVISATTTKIFPPSPEESPQLYLLGPNPDLEELRERLAAFGHITVARELTRGKAHGVSPVTINQLTRLARHVIVEADGASGLPIKAPEAWEPVIPANADLVIPVVGLDCLNRAISAENVFRVDRFLEVTGEAPGAPITPETIVRLLTRPEGMLKNIPIQAVVIPFLNKVDCAPGDALAKLSLEINRMSPRRISAILAGQLWPVVRVVRIY